MNQLSYINISNVFGGKSQACLDAKQKYSDAAVEFLNNMPGLCFRKGSYIKGRVSGMPKELEDLFNEAIKVCGEEDYYA